MLGIQFIKAQPTTYLLQFRKGQIVRQGAGLSFFFYVDRATGKVTAKHQMDDGQLYFIDLPFDQTLLRG